ncbi:MAG: hypothetical protein EXR27_17855 [Betaproteobacteria bacterium]|nr:hypothetical protein [Betaproteobacteria bacterium]
MARLRQFALELHPEKTRLLAFGPYAAARRRSAGLGTPETFNFLGFTHICAKKRSNARVTVLRRTMRKRLQSKLAEVKAELRRRLHQPIPVVGQWLGAVVRWHIGHYGVPMNGPALNLFRFRIGWLGATEPDNSRALDTPSLHYLAGKSKCYTIV